MNDTNGNNRSIASKVQNTGKIEIFAKKKTCYKTRLYLITTPKFDPNFFNVGYFLQKYDFAATVMNVLVFMGTTIFMHTQIMKCSS